eukprot:GHRR01034289.1.p1 GENE.GHRR01034289.1~~GHRR01034289.1.p1  ORF type:complete len:171 (+),score=36.20 GHRR01034289.1:290-802(+)
MAPARALKPRSVWDLPSVLSAFREHGIKERHVYKLWSSLLKDPDVALADIPDLPKAACQLLDEQFTLCSSTVLMCQQSAGADTTKLLIQLQDGMQVEAVVMHYDTSGADNQPNFQQTTRRQPDCLYSATSFNTVVWSLADCQGNLHPPFGMVTCISAVNGPQLHAFAWLC